MAVGISISVHVPKKYFGDHVLRDDLIEAEGHIIAPCLRERACPMAAADKPEAGWRHFAARFERSSPHQRRGAWL